MSRLRPTRIESRRVVMLQKAGLQVFRPNDVIVCGCVYGGEESEQRIQTVLGVLLVVPEKEQLVAILVGKTDRNYFTRPSKPVAFSRATGENSFFNAAGSCASQQPQSAAFRGPIAARKDRTAAKAHTKTTAPHTPAPPPRQLPVSLLGDVDARSTGILEFAVVKRAGPHIERLRRPRRGEPIRVVRRDP